MGETAASFGFAQWAQLLIGGGLAGLATSLVGTRIEMRRLRNEEAERTSYYEHKLFEARLDVYQELASGLAGLLDAIQDAIDPYRESNEWDDEAHRALFDTTKTQRALLYRQLMSSTLLFGPAMDDALGDWTSALNVLIGSQPARGIAPNDAFMRYGMMHYGVLQAMRSDLHLGKLDESLIAKLSGRR